jgi:hypothetical protein
MSAARSFLYKGFRIVCTTTPASEGAWHGSAQVIGIVDGMFRDRPLDQMRGAVCSSEQDAMDLAARMAREWIEGQR